MKVIQESEILLIYNSDKADQKKLTAFVEALPGFLIRIFDLAIESITETQLIEIANRMDVFIDELIDPSFDKHINIYREGLKLIAPSDMLVFMMNDYRLINTPIIVTARKA